MKSPSPVIRSPLKRVRSIVSDGKTTCRKLLKKFFTTHSATNPDGALKTNADVDALVDLHKREVDDGDLEDPIVAEIESVSEPDTDYDLASRTKRDAREPCGKREVTVLPQTDNERASVAADRAYKTYGNMYSEDKRKKPRRRNRRMDDNMSKIRSGTRHKAEKVVSPADMTKPEATKTGWSGKDYKRRPDAQKIRQDWLQRKIVHIMLHDHGFERVSYEGAPTMFIDRNGIVFGFRSDIPAWMTEVRADGRTWLDDFADECRAYMEKCGPRKDDDINANSRGDHWFMVIGVDRQNKKLPDLTAFHKAHMQATNDLLNEPCTIRLINLVKTIMDTRFPSLAQRVYDCEEKLRARGEGLEAHATPRFGCFYNYCINGPREGIVDGVSTGPHVDGKNLALMFCAVFVWGKFDHKEKAWLVLWEAKLIIELPPGVLMFYPSSLFTHFNVDISDLHIVTTEDGAYPTPANSSPLKGVAGRGSVVFFNQATMFQLAETGSSVKDARAQGKSAHCNNNEHLYRLPKYNL